MKDKIKAQIYLTQEWRNAPLPVVENSRIPIELEVMDVTLSGQTALVYAWNAKDGEYVQNGIDGSVTVSGQIVTIVPSAGLFLPGRGKLQVHFPTASGKIITRTIPIDCQPDFSNGGATPKAEAVKPLIERAEQAAALADEIAKSIPADYTNLSNDVNTLKGDSKYLTPLNFNYDKVNTSFFENFGTVKIGKNLRWADSNFQPVVVDGDDIVIDCSIQDLMANGIDSIKWVKGTSTQAFIIYSNTNAYNDTFSPSNYVSLSWASTIGDRIALSVSVDYQFVSVKADLQNSNMPRNIRNWIRNDDIPDNTITEDKLANKPNFIPLTMFNSYGAIGDSFTEGSVVDGQGVWHNVGVNRTYPKQIARRNSLTALNFGTSGATTRSYIQTTLPTVISSDVCDLYTLALGINDIYSLGINYIGNISDIETKADTFYGNYARIIEAVMNYAPKSSLILVKLLTHGAGYEQFNDAIENIANHYGIPFINPYDDTFFNTTAYTWQPGGHPTVIGYSGMSLAFERLIGKCIYNHWDYFKYAQI